MFVHRSSCVRLDEAVKAFNTSLLEHRNPDTLKRLNDTEKLMKVRAHAGRSEQSFCGMQGGCVCACSRSIEHLHLVEGGRIVSGSRATILGLQCCSKAIESWLQVSVFITSHV